MDRLGELLLFVLHMACIRSESIMSDITSSENIATKTKKRGKNKLQLPEKVNLWLGAYFPG